MEHHWSKGIVKPESIRREILSLNVEKATPLPAHWLDVFPGRHVTRSKDPKFQPSDWSLDEIGVEVILRVAQHKPISVGKAMLILQNLLLAQSQRSADLQWVSKVQIALANKQINSLDTIFRNIPRIRQELIYARLGGIWVKTLIDDMRLGFPVTQDFANKSFLRSLITRHLTLTKKQHLGHLLMKTELCFVRQLKPIAEPLRTTIQ